MSATYVVIFFGFLVAMGSLHASASNAVEEVREAQQYQNDHLATVQGTGIELADVTVVDAPTCDVNVTVNNTGDTTLSVASTDVFVDGVYEENVPDRSGVDGDGGTDLWRPGEQLEIDVGERVAAPDRVKVVSGPGVADTMESGGLTC